MPRGDPASAAFDLPCAIGKSDEAPTIAPFCRNRRREIESMFPHLYLPKSLNAIYRLFFISARPAVDTLKSWSPFPPLKAATRYPCFPRAIAPPFQPNSPV